MNSPVSRLTYWLTTGALSFALAVVVAVLFAMNAASEARDRAMVSRLDAQRDVNNAQSELLRALNASDRAQADVNRAAASAVEHLARRSPGVAQ
jgi:hypothetical protein